MSAILPLAPPHDQPPAVGAARLALKPDGGSRGLLDGAWWPRSRDLLGELPALIDVLDPLWGRITRVAVNPEHWPAVPREVAVRGRVVKVGWFTPELDPHKLLLLSYRIGRWDLLVVPPGSTAASAARLMAAASRYDGPPLSASELISADASRHDRSAADQPLDPDQAWEYEGGAAPGSAAVPEPAAGPVA
ncbi:DUF5994 family protein [Streptomyces boncukensis]|uniref:Uncharacterized protein n=1 Tax=Streptomyces boncukensis TaxID=2711219 RepID=A0A6G4WX21_9ACTN|nr:DUF5994 family protein [Streptomyces boncukensis]NGO69658.1 hypothetical protein [Streptomyces boncukensis]